MAIAIEVANGKRGGGLVRHVEACDWASRKSAVSISEEDVQGTGAAWEGGVVDQIDLAVVVHVGCNNPSGLSVKGEGICQMQGSFPVIEILVSHASFVGDHHVKGAVSVEIADRKIECDPAGNRITDGRSVLAVPRGKRDAERSGAADRK